MICGDIFPTVERQALSYRFYAGIMQGSSVDVLDLPSLKLTFSHLKMAGWNTIVSFWDGLLLGAMLVLGSVPFTTFCHGAFCVEVISLVTNQRKNPGFLGAKSP